MIFNFNRAHYILDEFIMAGDVMEPNWKCALRCVAQADAMERDKLFTKKGSTMDEY